MNSRRDFRMIEAETKLRAMLQSVADCAEEAKREFICNPRWCGIPDGDLSEAHFNYPSSYALLRWTPGGHHKWSQLIYDPFAPSKEQSYIKMHTAAITGMIRMFRKELSGEPDPEHDSGLIPKKETPRVYIDRIRCALRYADHYLIPPAFGMMRCVKGGSLQRFHLGNVTGSYQRYKYVPWSIFEMSLIPEIRGLLDATRAAFDHACVSLMPRVLTDQQRDFLTWIEAMDGKCTWKEMIGWVRDDPKRGKIDRKGQGAERKYLNLFCDKSSPRGTRGKWVVRPGALELLR